MAPHTLAGAPSKRVGQSDRQRSFCRLLLDARRLTGPSVLFLAVVLVAVGRFVVAMAP